ncbi:MAG: aminotransferase class I/II-fold pyridoxal phosphate-dependent enzyme [Candidatus Peribacteraceae bacterium]|nr:aminotransferase class I/II-fold pyridoxal phosphate-dependent enzyme [Candidatus Peribacteraceae bacterium]
MLIHHTFAPHVDGRYLLRAIHILLQPWKWRSGTAREEFRAALSRQFQAETALFASGREGLVALFRSLGGTAGDEIIVQAYTCVVVPNAITAAGYIPVYADVDRDTLSMDCGDVERKITPRTRAVLCQHTFGIPADTERLRAICDRHRLLLIEDCAHIIPDSRGPASIGTHGDAILLSFGRDKAISGITGGAILSRIPELSVKIRKEEDATQSLGIIHIKRLLLYPIVYAVARPLYGLGIGKALLVLARWIGALVPILSRAEKSGRMASTLHKLPNACAALALASLKDLQRINDHRRSLTAFYLEEGQKRGWFIPRSAEHEGGPLLAGVTPDLPLQKFPLFMKNADGIRAALKKRNIHLNDGWTGCIICPEGVDMNEAHYTPGSDPEAEAACEKILALPTHPTMTLGQAHSLIETLSPMRGM